VADPEHPALEALRSRLAQEEAAYAEVLAAIDQLCRKPRLAGWTAIDVASSVAARTGTGRTIRSVWLCAWAGAAPASIVTTSEKSSSARERIGSRGYHPAPGSPAMGRPDCFQAPGPRTIMAP